MEVWKDIRGFCNYEVSNVGKVRNKSTGRLRSPEVMKSGNYRVKLFKDGMYRNFMISNLVATHFIKNPNNYEYTRHLNGNKSDNRTDNIKWIPCNRAKLSKDEVIKIRRWVFDYDMRVVDVADRFNIHHTTVSKIICNEHWVD